jgi:hypothetical protein
MGYPASATNKLNSGSLLPAFSRPGLRPTVAVKSRLIKMDVPEDHSKKNPEKRYDF